MINKKQIENIGKFFWEVAKVMLASGGIAGIMMPNIPVGKVMLAIVFSLMSAVLAFICDSFIEDDKPPP